MTVFGLGISGGGVGTVEFLVREGAREIRVTDEKSSEELADSIAKIRGLPGVTFALGGHQERDFTEVDAVIKNPRIPWTNPFILLSKEKGIPVFMDSSIFCARSKTPIVGVTGTKGKTTTSSAIAHLLRNAGTSVTEVGIGETPVLSLLAEAEASDVTVFELSSWRLSALPSIEKSPHISVLTNIAPDHLNYYDSMNSYVEDKMNIARFQTAEDTLIYNAEDPWIVEAVCTLNSPAHKKAFSFADHGLEGMYVRDGDIVSREGAKETVFASVSDVRLPGKHMLLNMLAALAATRAFGIDLETLSRSISSFSGVPHRLELVAIHNGVRWYNDTAATIPDATIAALRSFENPIVLIAGGSDKNLEFESLGKFIAESPSVKTTILFSGSATKKLVASIRAFGGARKIAAEVSSMEEAVTLARAQCESGDAVLLSPGSASFGLFRNEFDRGNQFRNSVRAFSSHL